MSGHRSSFGDLGESGLAVVVSSADPELGVTAAKDSAGESIAVAAGNDDVAFPSLAAGALTL
jgi:hypothetical protein